MAVTFNDSHAYLHLLLCSLTPSGADPGGGEGLGG